MCRVVGCNKPAPAVDFLSGPPSRRQAPRPAGASLSASQVQASDPRDTAWQVCLSRIDALDQEFDARAVEHGTDKALRDQFERCKVLIQRAGKTLRALRDPVAMLGRNSGGILGNDAVLAEKRALSALMEAQREVLALTENAMASANKGAPSWLVTVGALAAAVAVALAAAALAVFFPAALPIAALTLIAMGMGAGAGISLPVLITQLVQSRRAYAAATVSHHGAETLEALNELVTRAAEVVRRHEFEVATKAAELIQKSWRSHAKRVGTLRDHASAAENKSKFVSTRHVGAGGTRTYLHYRDPQEAVKEGMPPTLPLWGAGQDGPQLGEGGYNSVQMGPVGLVIRREKQPVEQLGGVPIERYADLKSFVGAVRISSTVSVARFAGTPLNQYLPQGGKVPVSDFWQASHDLKTAHARCLFHRDIKPANMTLKGERVYFIDCDSMIEVGDGKPPPKYFRTLKYASVDPGKHVDHQQALKTADEFAFLVSMIEATTDDPDQISEWLKSRTTRYVLPPPAVEQWLEENSTDRLGLYKLLWSPSGNQLPNGVHLHDKLKWPARA